MVDRISLRDNLGPSSKPSLRMLRKGISVGPTISRDDSTGPSHSLAYWDLGHWPDSVSRVRCSSLHMSASGSSSLFSLLPKLPVHVGRVDRDGEGMHSRALVPRGAECTHHRQKGDRNPFDLVHWCTKKKIVEIPNFIKN